MKRYIWGFPGVGKSNIRVSIDVVDADCESFKFKDISTPDSSTWFAQNPEKCGKEENRVPHRFNDVGTKRGLDSIIRAAAAKAHEGISIKQKDEVARDR